jgi:hypothetical protein
MKRFWTVERRVCNPNLGYTGTEYVVYVETKQLAYKVIDDMVSEEREFTDFESVKFRNRDHRATITFKDKFQRIIEAKAQMMVTEKDYNM